MVAPAPLNSDHELGAWPVGSGRGQWGQGVARCVPALSRLQRLKQEDTEFQTAWAPEGDFLSKLF